MTTKAKTNKATNNETPTAPAPVATPTAPVVNVYEPDALDTFCALSDDEVASVIDTLDGLKTVIDFAISVRANETFPGLTGDATDALQALADPKTVGGLMAATMKARRAWWANPVREASDVFCDERLAEHGKALRSAYNGAVAIGKLVGVDVKKPAERSKPKVRADYACLCKRWANRAMA